MGTSITPRFAGCMNLIKKLNANGTRQKNTNTFGNIAPTQNILTSECLTKSNLEKLIVHESIDALIIPNFCFPTLCEKLSKYFLNSSSIERYDHDIYSEEDRSMKTVYAGVDRVGIPFNNVFSKTNKQERFAAQIEYYKQAQTSMRELRQVCGPCLSPIDHLRLDLEDNFTDGCRVARFEGNQMLCGICRITHAHLSLGGEQAHFDMLPEEIYSLDKQFAANVYIKVPATGGELQMWGKRTYSREEIREASFNDSTTDGTEPVAQIQPALGDLILFNTRRPHAVTRFNEGCRITLQTFIGYKQGEGLNLWN